MPYKRNKNGYYRAPIVNLGKKPCGKTECVAIRDKNLNLFRQKLGEAKRLPPPKNRFKR